MGSSQKIVFGNIFALNSVSLQCILKRQDKYFLIFSHIFNYVCMLQDKTQP